MRAGSRLAPRRCRESRSRPVLADPPRDELGVLRAEAEDEDEIMSGMHRPLLATRACPHPVSGAVGARTGYAPPRRRRTARPRYWPSNERPTRSSPSRRAGRGGGPGHGDRTPWPAPRAGGTRMLVFADGRTIGTVGGGAFEHRVIAEALSALDAGRPTRLTVNLSETSACAVEGPWRPSSSP